MGICGGGLQNRTVLCMRVKDLIPIDDGYCKEIRPPSIQQCNTECSKKCVVSEWSSWSSCLPIDTKDPSKSVRGYRKRTRKQLKKPTGILDDCPSLIEVNSCQKPEVVRWVTGNWSVCKLQDITQPCGEGVMKRESVCINPKGTHVSSSLCQMHLLPPKLLAPCYIPCPRDCVLAEWTEWSVCTVSCTSKEKKEFRTRQRRIIAEHGLGGKPCPAKDTLIESEPCNYESCIGYLWIKSEWSSCQIPKNRTCGTSFQIRNVQCVNAAHQVVSDERCLPEPKPMSRRGCNYPCPVDCMVTNFTEWTPCSDNCVSVQYRKRFILQSSMHGGYPCPSILEETRNCNITYDSSCINKSYNNSSIPLYFWDISSWSNCILADGLHCGKGYQIRKITCKKKDGKEVLIWNCMSADEDTILESSRSCYVYCNTSCSVSEWTFWSSENINNCPSLLKRSRERFGKSCDWINLEETKPFPLVEVISTPGGHWSECIVDSDNSQIRSAEGNVLSDCGSGTRYIRGNQIVSCEQKGIVTDMCLVKCPESCEMSFWTEWNPCNVSCGQGYRRRERYVIKHGNKMGRPCPVSSGKIEIQEDVCEISCDYYQWSTEEKGECEVISSTKCGSGIKNRTVSCKKINELEESLIVNEIFCDPSTRPPETVKCYLPCPDDCIVSSWSQWSECKQPCNSNYSRYRNRTVLRIALPSSGRRCPSLVQEEPCNIGYNCFHYKWFIGGWGSCILPDNTSCGKGLSSRTATCIRKKGESVSPDYCQKVPIPALSKPCYVECPIDCQLSQWSEWNDEQCKPCNHKGEKWRMRRIIQEASETGKPCSYDLIQKIPCPYQSCYHWMVGEWSDCFLQGAECGYGYKKRKVECHRTDGVVVNKEKCLRINITENIGRLLDIRWLEMAKGVQELQECELSCTGSCVMTDWSVWSHCHRRCREGQVVGYQTRSRTLLTAATTSEENCSQEILEQRPCWDGPCLTYNWEMKNGIVQCMRSDGVLVYGGCDNTLIPCYPECIIDNSVCDHTLGECVCLSNSTPIYNQTNKEHLTPRKLYKCSVSQNGDDISSVVIDTTTHQEIMLKYFPDDNEISFWMYAMICVGCGFIIFVIITIYLMCMPDRT